MRVDAYIARCRSFVSYVKLAAIHLYRCFHLFVIAIATACACMQAHSYWGWSDPYQSMWCCVGSALESHSKHGDTLFMQQLGTATPSLLMLLYDNAALTWPVPGNGAVATVQQLNTWTTSSLTVNVSVTVTAAVSFSLAMRVPSWAVNATATDNGQPVPISSDGNWYNISKSWSAPGIESIILTFPFSVVLERLDDDRPQFSNYNALVAGPFALGAITHTDNIIVGDNSSATPSWVRPVSAAERAAAVSFGAIGNGLQPVTYIRHDNVTGVWIQPLDLPGGNSGGNSSNPVYTLQSSQGYLGEGDDVFDGMLTLEQAEAMCSNITACLAFTFEGNVSAPTTPVHVYLKSAINFVASAGWYTYTSSRASDNDGMGGDEDGPDSTWIIDAPILPAAPAGAASIRSFNRPGEYLSCSAAGTQCSIAHNDGNVTTSAFQTAATFVVHSPGLNGMQGTASFESLVIPGSFVSWFGGLSGNGAAPLSIQANQAGNQAFANASSFSNGDGPNWLPPTLAYVATTADGTVAGSRDLLLYPVADIASEWYGV